MWDQFHVVVLGSAVGGLAMPMNTDIENASIPGGRLACTYSHTSADEPARDRFSSGAGLWECCLFLVQPENKRGRALGMLSLAWNV